MVNENKSVGWSPLIVGLVFIGLGVLFLLNDVGYFPDVSFWRLLPPTILIMLGVARLIESPHRRRGRQGGWLILVGALLMAHNLDVLTFRKSWPLFIIAAGTGILWRELAGRKSGDAHGC